MLFLSNFCFSQNKPSSEKDWLIDHYFKSEKTINEKLTLIFDLTIAGKYNDAKTEIYNLKSKSSNTSLAYSALLCYQGNICYYESKYELCIHLTDSALNVLSNDESNRYRIKAFSIKAKALSALNEFDKAEIILKESIINAKSINDKNGLAICYYIYSSIYSEKGYYEESKKLLNKSISIQ